MILQEMDEKKERYQEAVRGLLGALLVEISRNSKENSAGEESGLRETAGRQHLSRAFEYVSLHYMHEIRAEDLAEACHVSESHLRRLFAQSMGMSPMDYVNYIRIERACQRMKQTEESHSCYGSSVRICQCLHLQQKFSAGSGGDAQGMEKVAGKLSGKAVTVQD